MFVSFALSTSGDLSQSAYCFLYTKTKLKVTTPGKTKYSASTIIHTRPLRRENFSFRFCPLYTFMPLLLLLLTRTMMFLFWQCILTSIQTYTWTITHCEWQTVEQTIGQSANQMANRIYSTEHKVFPLIIQTHWIVLYCPIYVHIFGSKVSKLLKGDLKR